MPGTVGNRGGRGARVADRGIDGFNSPIDFPFECLLTHAVEGKGMMQAECAHNVPGIANGGAWACALIAHHAIRSRLRTCGSF